MRKLAGSRREDLKKKFEGEAKLVLLCYSIDYKKMADAWGTPEQALGILKREYKRKGVSF